MKLNLAFLFLFALMACKKENTPNLSLDEKVDKTMSTEKAKGTFSNGPYGTASGQAKIYTVGSGSAVIALASGLVASPTSGSVEVHFVVL